MKRKSRLLLKGFALMTALGAFIYGIHLEHVSASGYCSEAGKALSNDEKIRTTVIYLLRTYPPAVIRQPSGSHGWSLHAPKVPVPYKDVDEFFALNPDCCAITGMRSSEEGTPGFIERAMGTVSGFARINYQVRYLDENGILQSVLSKNHLPVSNCGRPTHFDPTKPSFMERLMGFRVGDLDSFNR